ncbi:Arm DNA-binding domain-containing protein [Secundilactobacillus silagei]|uniref:Arm DNA-binding domain-containing protein n=1 Tax=Secundilactobacillus silagei TaxID=1293415 RepID=UPI0025AF2100|nr:Arm DNA-binding domain-containing protein [Secundilactobacillus silagei]
MVKKGKKYYKFQAYLGTDPITGKRKQVSRSGFNSAKVAKTELDRLQYEAEHADPFQDDQITYGEVYDMWYKAWSATVVESTQNKVLGTFKYHISPVFKDLPITKINVRFCQQFVDKISESTKSMYSLKKNMFLYWCRF